MRILDESALGFPNARVPGPAGNEEPGRRVHRSLLEQGLATAEGQVLGELDLIRSTLTWAIEAARTGDEEITREVVARVEEARRRYAEAHDGLLAVIARQSPVAGDLRLAMALLHVNDRAERMAVQCVDIATLRSAMSDGQGLSRGQLDCLSEMARLAEEQIGQARRAFADRDLDAASRLRDHDLAINAHNRSCFALAVEEGVDEARREAAFFGVLMARAIERIGDNAVDIGHQLNFAVTGRLRAASPSSR
jgi:phosphate transport system protein